MAGTGGRNLRVCRSTSQASDAILEATAVVKFKRHFAARVTVGPCRYPVETIATEKPQPLLELATVDQASFAFDQILAKPLEFTRRRIPRLPPKLAERDQPLVKR